MTQISFYCFSHLSMTTVRVSSYGRRKNLVITLEQKCILDMRSEGENVRKWSASCIKCQKSATDWAMCCQQCQRSMSLPMSSPSLLRSQISRNQGHLKAFGQDPSLDSCTKKTVLLSVLQKLSREGLGFMWITYSSYELQVVVWETSMTGQAGNYFSP